MTSPREEVVLAREGQEAGMETNQVAVMLGDGGRQIVIPEFPRHALQGVEGMDMAAHESLEALAVSELHVEFATVALDQAEGIELARIGAWSPLPVSVLKSTGGISERCCTRAMRASSPAEGSMRT